MIAADMAAQLERLRAIATGSTMSPTVRAILCGAITRLEECTERVMAMEHCIVPPAARAIPEDAGSNVVPFRRPA